MKQQTTNEYNVEDSDMTDDFFKRLLQYREDLLSEEFVLNFMNGILHFQLMRKMIIVCCTILGLVSLSFVETSLFTDISSINIEPIATQFNSLSEETLSLSVLTIIMSLGFWLISAD